MDGSRILALGIPAAAYFATEISGWAWEIRADLEVCLAEIAWLVQIADIAAELFALPVTRLRLNGQMRPARELQTNIFKW